MGRRAMVILMIIGSIIIAYNLINQIKLATKSGERLSQSADELFRLEIQNKKLKENVIKRTSTLVNAVFMFKTPEKVLRKFR